MRWGNFDLLFNVINERNWQVIKNKVKEKGILDEELEKELENAREGGHLAAHFAQRLAI